MKRGYEEIKTPLILNEQLWRTSGHWDHYKDNMYFTKIDDAGLCHQADELSGFHAGIQEKDVVLQRFPYPTAANWDRYTDMSCQAHSTD